ncbi:diacylglycerol kinase (ATP) [Pseudobutyrivibrio sp. ACV-2]|uniref:diacylglycerol kinase family protein n=1 Tax=Pseudobutyrivibrio sp. ACV-2 TaxID=1520801 RepID=UPI000895B941|nr:diacylglycerol kinase family protein [Pseudobutyrivibrio sp. ACV-2]MBQ7148737.1 diacylglycerol kinase family protein [Pseudobutyrivibrio sp.]SEA38795.1 diacylglycerol kinase (ATP) [Pseudobutyrivibrio sp. ACV-2]
MEKKQPLFKSFGFAFEGIFNTIKTERNIKIHLFATIMVIIFGFILNISYLEWLICLLLFGLITSLELVNTSLEAVVDLATQERKPLAKKAKDAAAGAVLYSSIIAAIIGGIIFFPKLYNFIINLT